MKHSHPVKIMHCGGYLKGKPSPSGGILGKRGLIKGFDLLELHPMANFYSKENLPNFHLQPIPSLYIESLVYRTAS
jgi:hypothetical protein